MREGCKGSVASEARSGGVVYFRPGSAGARKGVNLIDGARLTERRGRGGRLGKTRTEKENVFLAKKRPTRGLDGPAGMILACGMVQPVGWLGQRPSGPRGRSGQKSGKRKFPN
jgi:hypothetical protein